MSDEKPSESPFASQQPIETTFLDEVRSLREAFEEHARKLEQALLKQASDTTELQTETRDLRRRLDALEARVIAGDTKHAEDVRIVHKRIGKVFAETKMQTGLLKTNAVTSVDILAKLEKGWKFILATAAAGIFVGTTIHSCWTGH